MPRTSTFDVYLFTTEKMTKTRHKYKPGDIVLVCSSAGPAIPNVHVRLEKRYEVPAKKGNTVDWPAYAYWDTVLVDEEEVKMLRKRFQIPYEWPNNVETYVFECDIVKKVKNFGNRIVTKSGTALRKRRKNNYKT